MQRLTIGAILNGLETLTETLLRDPVTSIWVMEPLTHSQRVYFRTTTTSMLELVQEPNNGQTPALISLDSGGSYPVVRYSGPAAHHPLHDLMPVLLSLTGYAGGDDNFSAAFTYLALDQNPETGEASGEIKVKNALFAWGGTLKTSDNLTAQALKVLLDGLIQSMPRLTPDMADDCVYAINERLQHCSLKVVSVTINPEANTVTVVDSQGNEWDDLSLFSTPHDLADEFIDLWDESGVSDQQARADWRRYQSELTAEEQGW